MFAGLFAGSLVPGHSQTIVLGTAADFAVLAATAVTNTGATLISGNLGLSPGTAVTGLTAGNFTSGSMHINDAAAVQANADASTAYNQLLSLTSTSNLSGQNLAGLTLTPGVYTFGSSAALTNGILTLDGLGQANPLFVFKIGSTLSTGTSSINLINGASSANTWFQVGSSATLGIGSSFSGTIISAASDTLNADASLYGRIFALNSAITLDTNQITAPSAIPEPSAYAAILGSLALLLAFCRRQLTARAAA